MRTLNKSQAIVIAVIVFVCLHYSLTLGSNYLANSSVNFPTLLPLLNLIAYILYVLSGFVASFLSKHKFVIVSLLAGLISAASAILIFGVGGEVFGVFVTLASGLVLGGVGGGLSFLLNRKAPNAL
jgi:sugar phosphate permease